ncbi:MAG: imelysin family protein [Pseudomonadota bacterium]
MLSRSLQVWLGTGGALMLLAGIAQASPTFDYRKVNAQALEQHLLPRYEKLRSRFALLAMATEGCSTTSNFDYAKLRQPFRDAVTAWGGVAHITFGPAVQNNRYERIFFWPDRKGVSRRQVARAMQSQPEGYADPPVLAKRSIGVQGLPAFELLITQPTVPEQAQFKCVYAKSLSRNLVNMATEIADAWRVEGEWSKRWSNPSPDNSSYLTVSEPTFALIQSFLSQIERVRDVEFFRPLGLARKGRKLPGPFARSDLTITYIAARIEALRSALVDSGLIAETIHTARVKKNQRAVEEITEVRFELDYLVGRTKRHAEVRGFFDADRTQEAAALGYPMKEIRNRAQNALAGVTDLPLGFNASDGD